MRVRLHAPLLLLLTLGVATGDPPLAAAQTTTVATSVRPAAPIVPVAIVVLRDGDAIEIADADAELLRSLREVGGFTRAAFSAVGLPELRLAAGCDDDGAACLDRLASALGATALVIRRTRTDARRAEITLSLIYHDRASSDAPLTATATDSEDDLAEQMPALVRSLYGVSPVVRPTTSSNRPWIWATLGSGAAVLLGGAILGISASYGEYTTLEANTSADVDRIESSYAAAHTRGVVGNVLLGAGAIILGLGGALLIIDLLGHRDEPAADQLDLAFSPSPDGGMLTLRHTSRSFL